MYSGMLHLVCQMYIENLGRCWWMWRHNWTSQDLCSDYSYSSQEDKDRERDDDGNLILIVQQLPSSLPVNSSQDNNRSYMCSENCLLGREFYLRHFHTGWSLCCFDRIGTPFLRYCDHLEQVAILLGTVLGRAWMWLDLPACMVARYRQWSREDVLLVKAVSELTKTSWIGLSIVTLPIAPSVVRISPEETE